MSKASPRADSKAGSRIERWQHWIAGLVSALLHVLFVILALWSSPVTVTTPQGADAGGRMAVQFIGETPPPVSTAAASNPPPKRPAAPPVQSTPVASAEDPLPPDDPEDSVQDLAQLPARTPPATPPAPPAPQRRSHTWGQPPGMLPEDTAPENAGLARSPGLQRGRGNEASSAKPNMEVGGYQVYYVLRSEARLRAWRDQGMTELFLPLPGTRQYMVCPLETALRQESGPCRLLAPDSPELANIGDAREVIDMQQVYRRGELVWRGPGPYK